MKCTCGANQISFQTTTAHSETEVEAEVVVYFCTGCEKIHGVESRPAKKVSEPIIPKP